MKFAQVTVALVALVGYAVATGYGSGSGSGGYGSSSGGAVGVTYSGGAGTGGFSGGAGSYGGGGARGFSGGADAPKPYNFDYNAVDEEGNSHYRNEQGDQNGNVKGTYGYTDVKGVYRVVEYVADENGFRANIRTNEPGVDGKESPADVVLTAEQPPAGIQDKYTSAGGRGSGGYGGGAHGGYSGGAGGGAGGSYGGGAGGGFSTGGGAGRGGAGVRSGKSGY